MLNNISSIKLNWIPEVSFSSSQLGSWVISDFLCFKFPVCGTGWECNVCPLSFVFLWHRCRVTTAHDLKGVLAALGTVTSSGGGGCAVSFAGVAPVPGLPPEVVLATSRLGRPAGRGTVLLMCDLGAHCTGSSSSGFQREVACFSITVCVCVLHVRAFIKVKILG